MQPLLQAEGQGHDCARLAAPHPAEQQKGSGPTCHLHGIKFSFDQAVRELLKIPGYFRLHRSRGYKEFCRSLFKCAIACQPEGAQRMANRALLYLRQVRCLIGWPTELTRTSIQHCSVVCPAARIASKQSHQHWRFGACGSAQSAQNLTQQDPWHGVADDD